MRMQHTSINTQSVMSPHWQSDLRAIDETLVGFDETLVQLKCHRIIKWA